MAVLKESNRTRSQKVAESDLKSPLKSPLKSRKSLKGLLSPNDDAKEKKSIRAKQSELKARRRSLNVAEETTKSNKENDNSLAKGGRNKANVHELQELYHNCIKLSSENKISSKNTWDLNLIEHLSELVKPESKGAQEKDGNSDLNFQKASCTLDAGVKIYSSRVDSIHTDAFKVLGGLHRTSNEQEDENAAGADAEDGSGEKKSRRSRKQVDLDPSATLEQNQDALNVKKFDLSFTVDPLFHQTSMKFDEGGAKGLLLNHLHVTQGCELVFDSCDNRYNRYIRNPGDDASEEDLLIDDFGSIAQQVEGLQNCQALRLTKSCKALESVLKSGPQMEEDSLSCQVQRWLVAESNEEVTAFADGQGNDNNEDDDEDDDPCVSDSLGPWMDSSMCDDDESDGEEVNQSSHGHMAFGESGGIGAGGFAPGGDNNSSTDWLSEIGLSSQFNRSSWAGMSHWRYRGAPPKTKASGGEIGDREMEEDDAAAAKEAKKKSKKAQMIDFENLPALPKEPFKTAKNEKEICLKTDPQSSLIEFFPEDVHYEVSNLGKLFSKPFTNLKQLSLRKGATTSYEEGEDYDDDDFGATSLGFEDDLEEEDGGSGSMFGMDAEDMDVRMVEQIDINYDKTSRQVDVKKLKEALWVSLQNEAGDESVEQSPQDFQGVLDRMGNSMEAAGKKEDISVHVSFICLLHLANENTLKIEDCPSMDRLLIQQG
jgi:condensin complex subunit 2